MTKPFLKWAGNKYKIVEQIKPLLQRTSFTRLVEPFVGSGAVFLSVNSQRYTLADANSDLINLYQHLKNDGLSFIEYCRAFFTSENNHEKNYYLLREQFNSTNDNREKAALFLYLNRHCYNGLCRYNSKGGFNVPYGRYKKPPFPETAMRNFWEKAQKATFCHTPFLETMSGAILGDVVYCDPPYQALSKTANFTSYSDTPFGWAEQKQLADMARQLASRGIPVLISNHDTPEIRDLYDGAELSYFSVQRFISCDGANRHKAPELLAYFAPTEKQTVYMTPYTVL